MLFRILQYNCEKSNVEKMDIEFVQKYLYISDLWLSEMYENNVRGRARWVLLTKQHSEWLLHFHK